MLWGTRGVRAWALPPGANGSGRARRTLAGAGDGRAEHTSLGPGCPRESVRAVPGAGTWGDLSGRRSRIRAPDKLGSRMRRGCPGTPTEESSPRGEGAPRVVADVQEPRYSAL